MLSALDDLAGNVHGMSIQLALAKKLHLYEWINDHVHSYVCNVMWRLASSSWLTVIIARSLFDIRSTPSDDSQYMPCLPKKSLEYVFTTPLNIYNQLFAKTKRVDRPTISAIERLDEELLLKRLTKAACLAPSNTMIVWTSDLFRRASRKGMSLSIKASVFRRQRKWRMSGGAWKLTAKAMMDDM